MVKIKKSTKISKTFYAALATSMLMMLVHPVEAEEGQLSTKTQNGSKVVCLGIIRPQYRVLNLASPSPNYPVKELYVKRGDMVTKGKVLGVMANNFQARSNIEICRATVKVAEAELELIKSGEHPNKVAAQENFIAHQTALMNNAKSVLERDRKLFLEKIISEEKFQNAEKEFDSAMAILNQASEQLKAMKSAKKEDVDFALSKIEEKKAKLAKAEANLELTLIMAPEDGKILDIYTYAGELPDRQGILAMGNVATMLVEAQVYVTDIQHVKKGGRAVITSDAFPEKLTGDVSEILSMVDFNSLYSPDPVSFADKRIVKVWITVKERDIAERYINSQVTVDIN